MLNWIDEEAALFAKINICYIRSGKIAMMFENIFSYAIRLPGYVNLCLLQQALYLKEKLAFDIFVQLYSYSFHLFSLKSIEKQQPLTPLHSVALTMTGISGHRSNWGSVEK